MNGILESIAASLASIDASLKELVKVAQNPGTAAPAAAKTKRTAAVPEAAPATPAPAEPAADKAAATPAPAEPAANKAAADKDAADKATAVPTGNIDLNSLRELGAKVVQAGKKDAIPVVLKEFGASNLTTLDVAKHGAAVAAKFNALLAK